MARDRRPKRRRGRNNATRRLGRINRLPVMPPSLDLQANTFTCWLRSETGVKVNAKYWVNIWNVEEILAFEYKNLMTVFAEYRVKRINSWFIPSVSITTTGVHAMAVYDDGENYFITPSLADVISSPGSHSAKVYQPLRSVWHRTEPKDKNWLDMNKVAKVFATALATSGTSIEGIIILDCHISFRGLKAASTKLRVNDVAQTGSSFEYVSIADQE